MNIHKICYFFAIIAEVTSKGDYGTTIKKIRCDMNEEYFANGTCSVKPIRRYVTVMNIRATLIKTMPTAWIRTRIFYKYQTYQPWIINVFADYCAFRKGAKNAIMDMVIGMISKYSNNTHPCPFESGEEFILKDLQIDIEFMPNLIPTGDYRVDLEYFSDGNQSIRYVLIETYISVRALTLTDMKMG